MLDQTASQIRDERNMAAFYRDAEHDRGTQEIGADAKGQWYLIRCEPGRDLTAQKWLASRKYGTFLPMTGLKRVLPGWLCAYVFDMDAMKERILAQPGVIGILRCHKKLPMQINVAFIQSLANEAWEGKALPAAAKQQKPPKQQRPKDRRKARRLKEALRKALKAKNAARILDIQTQITAFRQKHRAGDTAA
jgi:hypothetical protein